MQDCDLSYQTLYHQQESSNKMRDQQVVSPVTIGLNTMEEDFEHSSLKLKPAKKNRRFNPMRSLPSEKNSEKQSVSILFSQAGVPKIASSSISPAKTEPMSTPITSSSMNTTTTPSSSTKMTRSTIQQQSTPSNAASPLPASNRAPSPVPDVDVHDSPSPAASWASNSSNFSEEDETVAAAHLLQQVHSGAFFQNQSSNNKNTNSQTNNYSPVMLPYSYSYQLPAAGSKGTPTTVAFTSAYPLTPQQALQVVQAQTGGTPLPKGWPLSVSTPVGGGGVNSTGVMDPSKSYKPRQCTKKKECVSCHTLDTPMWRDSADGERLCNACGIRWKKYGVSCGSCKYIPRKYERSSSRCRKCSGTLVVTPVLPSDANTSANMPLPSLPSSTATTLHSIHSHPSA